MNDPLFMQLLALSLYTWFMGFTFCDGFQLHIIRKLIWFGVFLAVSIYVLHTQNEYDLALILSVSSLAALVLCYFERRKRGQGKP